MSQYEGWSNWETWNVALWIQNDEGLYSMAREYGQDKTYGEFAEMLLEFSSSTPDEVEWLAVELNHKELNEMMRELTS